MTVNKQEPSYLDIMGLNITKKLEDGTGMALGFGFRNSFPRITVKVWGKDGYNKTEGIIAPFTSLGLHAFLAGLAKIIDAPNDSKFKVACFNNVWENGSRTDKIAVQAEVIFGKDMEGLLYFNVSAAGKPKVSRENFYLLPDPKFFKYYKGDTEITSPATISSLAAANYLETLNAVVIKYREEWKLHNNSCQNKLSPPKETAISTESKGTDSNDGLGDLFN